MANGKVGAPLGSRNAAKNKPWSDAIRRALARREKGHPKRLNRLADALLDKCEEGDIPALKEFGDRVEGKVPQAITGADGGAIEIAQIQRVVVDDKKPDDL
jgi:hypothetical protein